MRITSAEFTRSISRAEEYFNDGLPEIAVVGKSNVGKSSLINMLTNNGKLARVSKQPGKTRAINYFLLNKEFYLVDLPGYGFARIAKSEKSSWDEMMAGIFRQGRAPKVSVNSGGYSSQTDKRGRGHGLLCGKLLHPLYAGGDKGGQNSKIQTKKRGDTAQKGDSEIL